MPSTSTTAAVKDHDNSKTTVKAEKRRRSSPSAVREQASSSAFAEKSRKLRQEHANHLNEDVDREKRRRSRSRSPPIYTNAFRRENHFYSASYRSRPSPPISFRTRAPFIRGGRPPFPSRFNTRGRPPRIPYHCRPDISPPRYMFRSRSRSHSRTRNERRSLSRDRRSFSPPGRGGLRGIRGDRASRRRAIIGSYGRPIFHQPDYDVSPDRTAAEDAPNLEEIAGDRDELFEKMMQAKRSENLDEYYRLRDALNAFDRRNPQLAFRGSGRVKMAEMRQGRNDERHWKDKKDEDGKKEEDGECDQRPEGAEEEELEEVDCSAGEELNVEQNEYSHDETMEFDESGRMQNDDEADEQYENQNLDNDDDGNHGNQQEEENEFGENSKSNARAAKFGNEEDEVAAIRETKEMNDKQKADHYEDRDGKQSKEEDKAKLRDDPVKKKRTSIIAKHSLVADEEKKGRHENGTNHHNGSEQKRVYKRSQSHSPSPPAAFRRQNHSYSLSSASYTYRVSPPFSFRSRAPFIRGGRPPFPSRFSTRGRPPRIPYHCRPDISPPRYMFRSRSRSHSRTRNESRDRRSFSPPGRGGLRGIRGDRASRRRAIIGSYGRPIFHQPDYEVSPDRTAAEDAPDLEEIAGDRDELFEKMMEAKRSENLDEYYRLRDALNAFDRRNPHLAFRGSGRVMMAEKRRHSSSNDHREHGLMRKESQKRAERLEQVDCPETAYEFDRDDLGEDEDQQHERKRKKKEEKEKKKKRRRSNAEEEQQQQPEEEDENGRVVRDEELELDYDE